MKKPKWYNPQRTTEAPNKIDADLAYEKASKWIGAEIINDISIEDIKEIFDRKIKVNDISERIDAIRKIKWARAYANAKFIEDKKLTNSENFSEWEKIFKEKLDAPNDSKKEWMKQRMQEKRTKTEKNAWPK